MYLNQIITKCGCVVGILALCLVALRFRSQCGDRLSCQLFVQFSSVPPSSCWIVEGVSFAATPCTAALSHMKPTHASTSYDSPTVPPTRLCYFLPYHILSEALFAVLAAVQCHTVWAVEGIKMKWACNAFGPYTCGHCALVTSSVHSLVTQNAALSPQLSPTFLLEIFMQKFAICGQCHWT